MIAAEIAIYALWIFIGLMFVRLIIGYVMLFNRNFRPSGMVAAVLEIAYTVTDPPIRAIRRVIPPLRLGNASIDLGFYLLFVTAFVLIDVINPYA